MPNVINLPTYEQAIEMLEKLGVINTNVANINNNVNTVKNNVATINTNVNTANTNINAINSRTIAMQNTLNTVNTSTSRGAIKSVQRGIVTHTSAIMIVTIARVVLPKSIVLISSGSQFPVGAQLIDDTTIRILAGSGAEVNWQVLEFY